MSEEQHIELLAEPILLLPRQLYCLELNPLELDHIQEIQLACRASSFYDENRLQLIGEAADLVYALNLAEPYVKKTIKFIKSIAAFRQLNQDVQLTMLKSFFTELLLIRFAFVFDQEKDGFAVFEVKDIFRYEHLFCSSLSLSPLSEWIMQQGSAHSAEHHLRGKATEHAARLSTLLKWISRMDGEWLHSEKSGIAATETLLSTVN